MMMLTVLGCEEWSGSTKVYRGSCGVNPTVTGEQCCDLSQSKPEIIQAMYAWGDRSGTFGLDK